MINVQLDPDGPITQMDEADLVKRVGSHDDEFESAEWIEYRLRSDHTAARAVHRSVHVTLKKTATLASGEIGNFS
jgi:hypothetical protein